jgi:SAM-dependent methyltransferase
MEMRDACDAPLESGKIRPPPGSVQRGSVHVVRLLRQLRAAGRRLAGGVQGEQGKYAREEEFWRREIDHVSAWFRGELTEHFGTPAPTPEQRRLLVHEHLSAIATWLELHQKPKYLTDLELRPNAFQGLRVLDVGAGPMPSGEALTDHELYCLDPLYSRYLQAGWPLHIYRPGTRFVQGYAEHMPLEDGYFDAVISVNAMDHVDDFERTAEEIRRVLKPGGMLCMHLHYHPPAVTEPVQLDDGRVGEAFHWCSGLRKRRERTESASTVADPGEAYALWANFEV